MNTKREYWVDYIKVIACLLVALGHFLQSMVKANIIPETNVYCWFDTTIYYFHVPLFFVCSGYLYQKYSQVDSWVTWKQHVIKKAIYLGIPYFTFSTITWLMKTVFSEMTNNEIGGIIDTFFVNPYPPYWYLYILFIIFLITPTMNSGKGVYILLIVSVTMKTVICSLPRAVIWEIYALYGLFSFEIWFVLGMCMAVMGAEKIRKRFLGAILFISFIGLSIYTFRGYNRFIEFGMAVIACLSIFMLMVLMQKNTIFEKLTPYTMSIFLMHTLIAAPVRILLEKLGVENAIFHMVVGITASIAGPIVAYIMLRKLKLDFLIFPGKFLKKRREWNG